MDINKGKIEEIDLDGFQIVSSDYFKPYARRSEMTMTMWPTSISFSKASISALNVCENIRIEIGKTGKQVLIVPTTSKDIDAIKWLKKSDQKIESRKLECRRLTSELYEKWNLDKETIYRASGILATSDNKVMLLFDFSSADIREVKRKDG